jgi:hypothetical protein
VDARTRLDAFTAEDGGAAFAGEAPGDLAEIGVVAAVTATTVAEQIELVRRHARNPGEMGPVRPLFLGFLRRALRACRGLTPSRGHARGLASSVSDVMLVESEHRLTTRA